MLRISDAAVLLDDATKIIGGGYLVTVARSVRTGVQLYTGDEVGKPELPIVRVYRPPSEVFSDASLQSFSHAPVTIDHPAEMVTAENWDALSVGEVSTAAKKDGEWVMLPLIVKDAKAIATIRSGKSQLSAGYTCELDWTPGTLSDGSTYDAVQRNIRINHLAVVDNARAGQDARIGDSGKWAQALNRDSAEPKLGGSHMTDKLQKVVVDGLTIETTDQGAEAIAKLNKQIGTLDGQIAAKDAAIVAKDKELAAKDAEIAELKAKVLDTKAIDARVVARADLIAKAKSIVADAKTDGLSDEAIRKAIVVAKLGDEMNAKSDAYIEARFDMLADDAKNTNGLAVTLAQPGSANLGDRVSGFAAQDAAYKQSVQDLNAWRNKK